VLLSQWELEADYFAQDFMSGIIPVLFAEDPKAAELAILADEYTAMKDLDRINRSFFIPETIDLEAAFKVVKKPRLGDAEYLFKTENLDRLFEQPPPRKGILFNEFNIKDKIFELLPILLMAIGKPKYFDSIDTN
jgi:hypothetical protein